MHHKAFQSRNMQRQSSSTVETACKNVQEVCELSEVKWRSLSIAVMQRLKRLLSGVSDPEAVKRENAAREERKALAAKHKAEAKRHRKIERQRSVTLLERAPGQELIKAARCHLLQP